jgi:hypothetical protein
MARKCDKREEAGGDKAGKVKTHEEFVAFTYGDMSCPDPDNMPQACCTVRLPRWPRRGEGEARIIECSSMKSPDAEKQKPAIRRVF